MDSDEDKPRRSRRAMPDSDDEDSSMRRRRRGGGSDDESPSTQNGPSNTPGDTMKGMAETKRKKIQAAVIDAMFKIAKSKYNRERPKRAGEEDKQSAMEDYELYLRSINAKVKTASDKLANVQKQQRDINAKVEAAEKEAEAQKQKLATANKEKEDAISEGRDPVLPKDFIVPQRPSKSKAKAGLGALVMKASAEMWEDKFSALRAKKQGSSGTPEWMQKQKKSDKTSALLTVGRKKTEKGAKTDFGTGLKKSEGRRRRRDEEEPKNAFNVQLKKTDIKVNEKGQDPEQESEKSTPAQPVPEATTNVFIGSDDEEEKPRKRFGRRGSDSD